MKTHKKGFYERFIKRTQDFILSLLALVILSPVMLITAILVRLVLGSPVIFSQERVGLNEKIFKMYKFRTMTEERDKNGILLPDGARLSKFGKFLRSTSLDELPELFNILKNDMAVVGPRPLLARYLPFYNVSQRGRHDVRPGLSGRAQVNGRNAIGWEEKFRLDVEYVDNVSLIGDWRIIFLTLRKVIAREGINPVTAAIVEPFKGTAENKALKSGFVKDRLLIIGAGGHGKVAADIALKMNKWQSVAFLDDNEAIECCMGLKVVGRADDASSYINAADFFVAIGDNGRRRRIQERLEEEGASVIKLIHPSAVIGTDVGIEAGSVVMAGVVINCSTSIGKGCIINTGSSLDHDNMVKDYAHVSPGVRTAGNVMVGNGSWLGIGSVVSNNICICSGCIVGAGAVVVDDITESGTYVGVPARRV